MAGTLAVERWGEFLIHQGGQPLFRLEAKLDRVLVRAQEPGRLVVRDYKTSRSGRVNLAEALVVLWVARLCFPGNEQYGLLLSRLQSVLAGEEHAPVPGDLCAFCPLRPECQPLMDVSALTGAFL